VASFAQTADRFDPAEGFFNDFAALETLSVTFAASGTAVDGTAGLFAGHMGFDVTSLELFDESCLVVAFVGPTLPPLGTRRLIIFWAASISAVPVAWVVSTSKPAKQQVVVQLLHQLTLAANGVQHLQ